MWYGCVMWDGVSYRKIVLLPSRTSSSKGLYNQNMNYNCFYCILYTSDLFATKLCLMVHHHKLDCLKKIGLLYTRSRSQQRFQMCECLSGQYFLNLSTFHNQAGIVAYFYELNCDTEKLFCYLQGEGHSEGVYNQNMTISTTSFILLILLEPNLVWWYIIISWNVLWNIGLLCSRSR